MIRFIRRFVKRTLGLAFLAGWGFSIAAFRLSPEADGARIITFVGFFVGAVLLLVANLMFLVRRRRTDYRRIMPTLGFSGVAGLAVGMVALMTVGVPA